VTYKQATIVQCHKPEDHSLERTVTLTNEYAGHICENYSERDAAFMNIAEA
jgi:hypothetical protein